MIIEDQDIAMVQDSLVLYNVITPNGDGQNDRLVFDFLDQFEEHEILILDQWGSKVYESLDYNNDWDGRKDGEAVPAGSYKYFLRLDGEVHSSNLTIIYN